MSKKYEYDPLTSLEELDNRVVSLASERWDLMKVIGTHFRKLRTEAGLSTCDISKRMKCSRPYISDLELGRRTWSQNSIIAYQKALKKQ